MSEPSFFIPLDEISLPLHELVSDSLSELVLGRLSRKRVHDWESVMKTLLSSPPFV